MLQSIKDVQDHVNIGTVFTAHGEWRAVNHAERRASEKWAESTVHDRIHVTCPNEDFPPRVFSYIRYNLPMSSCIHRSHLSGSVAKASPAAGSMALRCAKVVSWADTEWLILDVDRSGIADRVPWPAGLPGECAGMRVVAHHLERLPFLRREVAGRDVDSAGQLGRAGDD